MSAVTQWFLGRKPVHPGVYENGTRQARNHDDIRGGLFQYWNGESFCCIGGTPEEAASELNRDCISHFQNDPWRGLAVKP